jgi:hypothetical protein
VFSGVSSLNTSVVARQIGAMLNEPIKTALKAGQPVQQFRIECLYGKKGYEAMDRTRIEWCRPSGNFSTS